MAEEKAIATRARELSREELRYGKGTIATPAKGPDAEKTQGESHVEEMPARHGKEMDEMHGRHAKEMAGMHDRHLSEHKDMMKRHTTERGGASGGDTANKPAPGEKKDEKKVASADSKSKDDAQKGKREGDGKAA